MDIFELKEKHTAMTEPSQDDSNNSKQAEKTSEDLTGRDRLVSNILFSWGAHFVYVVAGFIMPRMIDRRLGQELLGIWDFAWSLVSYFTLLQVGIGPSVVSRYVSRYRAAGDISGMNQIVSSASCILGVIGLLVLGLTITVSLLLPQLFGALLEENISEAQWVVFFLGTSLVVEISFSAFTGVLTGCHKWKHHHIIKSGWYAVTVVGMILALLQGGSLSSLAVICFVGYVLAYTTRVILAHHVCEGLRLRPSLVGWEAIRKLFVFGGKSLIPFVSNILVNQTINILIVVYLGPAALAMYLRPRSLIKHIRSFVQKMANTLIPTSSTLESVGDLKEIRELLIKSVRYSFYMVLPMVLVLIVFGGSLLQLWMGSRYANGLIPAILAVGYLTTLVQLPVLAILTGLNAHGRAGVAQFFAFICSAGLTILVLGPLEWGLAGVAVAVTLPLTIMNIIYLPYLICRRVNLDMRRYFLSVTIGPTVLVLPFAICLVVARLVFNTEPLMGLVWGGVAGGAVLMVLYWRFVLPESVCLKILRIMRICTS